MKHHLGFRVFFILVYIQFAKAEIFEVDWNAPVGSVNSPFKTLEEAFQRISTSVDPVVTINIRPGTYIPTAPLILDNVNKNVEIIGSANTILQCPNSGVGISVIGTNSKLQNLQITNCKSAAAISLSPSANTVNSFINVNITDNVMATSPVVIIMGDSISQVNFQNCNFLNNTIMKPAASLDRDFAGVVLVVGLSAKRTTPDVIFDSCNASDNIISTPKATGGFLTAINSFCQIRNMDILRNILTSETSTGGGIDSVNGLIQISNSRLAGNRAATAGAIASTFYEVRDSVIDDHSAYVSFGCFRAKEGGTALFERVKISRCSSLSHSLMQCYQCKNVTFWESTISEAVNTKDNGGPPMYFATVPATFLGFYKSVIQNVYSKTNGFIEMENTKSEIFNVEIQDSVWTNITVNTGIFHTDMNSVHLNLILKNSTFDRITSSNVALLRILQNARCNAVMENITVTNSSSKGLIHINSNANITIMGDSKIFANSITSAAPLIEMVIIKSKKAFLSLDQVAFHSHKESTPVSLVGYNFNVNIRRANFSANTSSKRGGAISLGISDSFVSIQDSIFNQNEANYGGAIICEPKTIGIETIPGNNNIIEIKNNLFHDNHAFFGAVMYASLNQSSTDIQLSGNSYSSNHADTGGGLFYFPRKYYSPDNIYLEEKGMLPNPANHTNTALYGKFWATDPYSVKASVLVDNKTMTYSGANLPEISFWLLDEFGQTVMTQTKNILTETAILMQAKISHADESNAKISGGLCVIYGGSCKLRGQIFGLPGVYNIEIGPAASQYTALKSNIAVQNVSISGCPRGLANITISNIEFPVCQIPQCKSQCVNGVCISNDVCLCTTGYTGATCAEHIIHPVGMQLYSILQVIAVVLFAISGVLVAIIVAFGWKVDSFKNADKLYIFGSFCGSAVAYISIIIQDTHYSSLSCLKSPGIQRLAFLLTYLSTSVLIIRVRNKDLQKSLSEKKSPGSPLEKTESINDEKSQKTKQFYILLASILLYIGVVVAWLAIPESSVTYLEFLSSGMFYPKCKNTEFMFAIVCLELCMMVLVSYWSLPLWEYTVVHKEIRYASIALYNWIIAGPLLNIVSFTVLNLPDARLTLNAISIYLTYIAFMGTLVFHCYCLIVGKHSPDCYLVPPKKEDILKTGFFGTNSAATPSGGKSAQLGSKTRNA